MQYQVLVENRADGLFSATVVSVPDCVAEGTTQEEALTNAKAILKERLAKGVLFTIELEEPPAKATPNPWLEVHGSLRDDPTFDDFMAEITGYRQQRDVEESEP
jgi:predicted RNase H-like HicB family nuclease